MVDRIHMALARLAKDFKVDEPEGVMEARRLTILGRTMYRRRPIHKTSSAIASRFSRELWAHVRHSPTKRSTDAYKLKTAAEKHSQARPAKPTGKAVKHPTSKSPGKTAMRNRRR